MANIWLLFLIFPVITILTIDLGTSRKIAGLVLVGVFAVVHALGYRLLIQSALGQGTAPTSTGWRRLADPNRSELWLGLLVLVMLIGFVLVGWAMVTAIPFVLTFAIFNFSWRTAGIVGLLCLIGVIAGPLAVGRLDELWFLTVILLSAGIGAAIARFGEERQLDLNALETQLALSEERTRVARDVHDVLGHSLTAIVLKTQVAERALETIENTPPEVELAREQIIEMQTISRRALAEIRETVSGLRVSDLGDEVAAARSVLADAGVSLTVHGDTASVPDSHHAVLGWTVREAVTNIVRHAEAERCTIKIGGDPELLSIVDDGVGRSTGGVEGNGLTGLRERLATAGLALRIDDADGTILNVLTARASS
ncbi:MAG: sensor histidine kinase [Acidimicrobiales bacterium]